MNPPISDHRTQVTHSFTGIEPSKSVEFVYPQYKYHQLQKPFPNKLQGGIGGKGLSQTPNKVPLYS